MDTCDECGPNVVAYVNVDIPVNGRMLPLSYCGHCATKHWDKLWYAGIIREDRRDKVNA